MTEQNNQNQPPQMPAPKGAPGGPQGQPPVSRTTVISIILGLMVAFFVGSQFMSFNQQQSMQNLMRCLPPSSCKRLSKIA